MVEEIRASAKEYPPLLTDPSFIAAVDAVSQIRREDFVPSDQRINAYHDTPLPIGYEQTISDPYVVAIMTAATGVRAGANVLEVGTGSGYQAAVLSRMGATVHSVEIVAPLADSAGARLHRLKFRNVSVKAGDGFEGWADFGPYDAIIVTAGAADVPLPLLAQLKVGGKLVMPLGLQGPLEQLVLVTKLSEQPQGLSRCSLGPAQFVPLTGRGQRPTGEKGLYDRSLPVCYAGQTAHFPW